MVDTDPLSYPVSKQLRKAGLTRVTIESPYIIAYVKDNHYPLGERPLFMTTVTGSFTQDRSRIRQAAERVLPFHTAQLLTYQISMSDYFLTLQSNDKALEQLRDEAALSVAKSILKPKNSETHNAAASTNVGIRKSWLSKTIENVIDVTSNQADKTIERLISMGKLIEIPRSDKMQESDDTIVLG